MWQVFLKTGLALAAFLAATACFLPTVAPASAAEMIRRQFDIKDAAGQTFRIFTAHPAGKSPQNGWPVIWMLDGNMTFPLGLREKPDTLLVGIGYPLEKREDIVRRRYYDLTTPLFTGNIPLPAGQAMPQTGGGAAYLRFILEKLRPSIMAHYPVDANRQTLYGHSLAGLFVIRALIGSPPDFDTYCAADPSIWWNSHEIMTRLATWQTGVHLRPQPRLRITLSGKRASRPGLSKEDADRLSRLRAGPDGKTVYDRLRRMKNIQASFKAYRQETHGSLVAASLRDCLVFSAVMPTSPSKNNDKHI